MSPQASLLFVRGLALVAVSGGVAAVIWGIAQLSSEQAATRFGASYHLVEALLVFALLSQLGGLFALHLAQAGSRGYGRLGTAGFSVATVGAVALLASTVASLVSGGSTLGSFFVVGAALLTFGALLLAFATFRAAVLPRWSAIPVAGLLLISLGELGVLLNGLVWVTLGYVLLPEQPSSGHAQAPENAD